MKNEFTLTIYSEDQLRLINKLSSMFIRKQVAILSLNMSLCEIENMYRHTIVVNETLDTVTNLSAQIEKIIEVYKCFYSTKEQIVSREVALFKIPTVVFMANTTIESLLQENSIKISEIQKEYTILEATGTDEEIISLTEKLNNFGLIEYVKSSRIALMQSPEGFCAEN
ncbi:MAG: acetolactate synthase small subunit [Flavobacterium sp.]|uniref:acetolactate synthase small subunit n=1 Tax=Flavobacterium sp. TaxID=239 RepID=UPI001B2854EA|nr:acetolactate synthase small subunit [Flavobacterium sp.]MBO9584330.1 acetolactate synthase small subunit [Flavobacterium sp.]